MTVKMALLAMVVLQATVAATPLAAQPASNWMPASGRSNLGRPAVWEGFPPANAADGVVTIQGQDDDAPRVDRYGPLLDAPGDFNVLASVQAATDALAV